MIGKQTDAVINTDRRTINPEALEKLRLTIIDLFSQNTFNDIGVRDICREAKVSPQTVYKYFGNKESLLYACIKQDIEGLFHSFNLAAVASTPLQERLLDCGRVFFRFYENNPAIARIIFLNIPPVNWIYGQEFSQDPLMDALKGLLEEARDQKLIPELPIQLMQDMMAGAAHRVILRWLYEEPDQSLSEIAETFLLMLKSSLMSNHPLLETAVN